MFDLILVSGEDLEITILATGESVTELESITLPWLESGETVWTIPSGIFKDGDTFSIKKHPLMS